MAQGRIFVLAGLASQKRKGERRKGKAGRKGKRETKGKEREALCNSTKVGKKALAFPPTHVPVREGPRGQRTRVGNAAGDEGQVREDGWGRGECEEML